MALPGCAEKRTANFSAEGSTKNFTENFIEDTRENDEENTDTQEPMITEDSSEQYVAGEAVLNRGALAYNIRVIGSSNQ